MMKKRAQAAMEFLMTYGWAILAAVIVVGVLWYMIGNPANLAGNNFQVAAPFVGNAMNFDSAVGGMNLEIRNGAGEKVEVSSIEFLSANHLSIPSSDAKIISPVLVYPRDKGRSLFLAMEKVLVELSNQINVKAPSNFSSTSMVLPSEIALVMAALSTAIVSHQSKARWLMMVPLCTKVI